MITANIKKAPEKVMHQETGTYFLDVRFDLMDGEVNLGERSLGFPIDTDEAVIKSEIVKYCNAAQVDAEFAVKNADFEAQTAKADETISKLTGIEIKAE